MMVGRSGHRMGITGLEKLGEGEANEQEIQVQFM